MGGGAEPKSLKTPITLSRRSSHKRIKVIRRRLRSKVEPGRSKVQRGIIASSDGHLDTAIRLQRQLQLGQASGNGCRRGAVAARLSDVGRGGQDRDRPEVILSLCAIGV